MSVNGSSRTQRPFSPSVYPHPPPILSTGLVKIQQGRSSGERKVPRKPLASTAKHSFDYQPNVAYSGLKPPT